MTAEEHERHRRKIQEQLDEALEASFPASDPVSIVTSQEEEDWGEPAGATPTDIAKEVGSEQQEGAVPTGRPQ
jgi:hypothetical protein